MRILLPSFVKYAVIILLPVCILLLLHDIRKDMASFQYKVISKPQSYPLKPELGENSTLEDIVGALQHKLSLAEDRKSVYGTQLCRPDVLSGCTNESCPSSLSNDLKSRAKDVMMSSELMLTIQEIKDIKVVSRTIKEADVIFLTAATSEYYDQLQALVQNIHSVVLPRMPGASLVIFDIGLTALQAGTIQSWCGCQVLPLPKTFPTHVYNHHCYAWKPIIIKAAVPRAKSLLVYADTNVLFQPNFKRVLKRATTRGVQFSGDPAYQAVVPILTHQKAIEYMGNHLACAFSPFSEVQTTYGVFHNEALVNRMILEPWARCALDANCINCPTTSSGNNPDCSVITNKPGQCYRYDQSVLTLLLAKLYNKEIHRTLVDHSRDAILVNKSGFFFQMLG